MDFGEFITNVLYLGDTLSFSLDLSGSVHSSLASNLFCLLCWSYLSSATVLNPDPLVRRPVVRADHLAPASSVPQVASTKFRKSDSGFPFRYNRP